MTKRSRALRDRSNALVELKNQVRGAFAALDNRTPAKTGVETVAQERRGITEIKRAVANARARLRGRELEEFELWVDSQYLGRSDSNEISTSRTRFGLIPEGFSRKPLRQVLQLARDTLTRAMVPLREFGSELLLFDRSLLASDLSAALAQIERISNTFGYSFWAIEARFAVLAALGKADELRALSTELSIGAVGLNAFYFYHFVQRNDPSQSSSRFRAVVGKRIGDSKLSPEYKIYADYRVARTVPSNADDLSALLSYELLTTKIDLLLTSRRIALEILSHRETFEPEVIVLAEQLLWCAALGDTSPHTLHAFKLSDSLERQIDLAIRIAMGEGVVAADCHETLLSRQIAATVTYSDGEAEEDHLKKRLLNFWWTADAMMLDSAGTIPRLPSIVIAHEAAREQASHPVLAACAGSVQASRERNPDHWRLPKLSSPPQKLPWDESQIPAAVIDSVAALLSWKLFEADEYEIAMRLMQFALLRNPRLLSELPLDRMFRGVEFDRIRTYGIGIDLCNCLNWYSQVSSERQVRTFKRFAVEELVNDSGKGKIIEFAETLDTRLVTPKLAEYFLANTCDLATIELMLEVDGTRDALRIREKLLRIAAEISELSSAQLSAEADSIADNLEVDIVLDELDETKVSVDEEALLPVVVREIAVDFDRYRQLTRNSSSSGTSLDDLVRSLRQQSPLAFQIPKSESDNLLAEIIQSVLDRFIDDPVYGLDTIIGRRIRHGTISDELRGTLEHLHLIGQRPRTGADYDVPNTVATFLGRYDQKSRRGATRAFARFSQSIDHLVAQLRDEVFQCKSKGHLKPAFELPLGVLVFALARDAAATVTSVEAFIRELFYTFWFTLSTLVERERVSTNELMSRTLRDACLKFIADLRGAKVTDAAFLASIQRASEELQRRSDIISSWIRVPKVSQSGRTYPLQLVLDAAVAFCKARRAGFEPTLKEDVDQSVRLDAHGYPIVFDALCIAIGNVADHSGIKQGNKTTVQIRLTPDGSKLRFTVECDLSRDAMSKDRLQKIDAIREDIAKRNFADRARRASGSGLAKLAAIVHQRPGCELSFGPAASSQKFLLMFELVFISKDDVDDTQQSLV